MPTELPPACAWRHDGSGRSGFEVCYPQIVAGAPVIEGQSVAVEDGDAWDVRYEIAVDRSWNTVSAIVDLRTASADETLRITRDESARWVVDGQERPDLDGCLDVDLESSACTNTLPIHRMQLLVGDSAEAPAAYVRAQDLRVERLEQHYARLDDRGSQRRYAYRAPAFDFEAVLVYDEFDLVLDYPGIAHRVL